MTKKAYIISACLLATAICTMVIAKSRCESSKCESIPAGSSESVDFDTDDNTAVETAIPSADEDIPKGAEILMKCYPNFIKGYKDGKLQMSDGSTLVYDDGRQKSFVEKLDNSDPEDMFAFKYNRQSWTTEYLQDAGRSRCEALFKKMYGASAQQVQSKLISVKWFDANGTYGGASVKFTPVNGASEHLKAVAEELSKMPQFKKYYKSEGTFYWRQVRGANRLSAHSYGMTIDIGGNYKTYWLWSNPGASETSKIGYQNKIPHEIVEVFEKHGFIWGGRWYHYDTMHFEYRPEILMANP